jgi:opacity protein-like surface antigen
MAAVAANPNNTEFDSMKKIVTIVCAAALSCLGTMAHAQNWYVSGFGAMNYTHDGAVNGSQNADYNLGFGLGGTVGYAMPNGLRLEGEISYRQNDIDSIGGAPSGGELDSWAFMGNAVYEFNVQSSVKPHIGGGLGVVRGAVDYGGAEYTDTQFGAQFIAGVDYKVAPDLALVLDYHYLVTEDFGFGAGSGLGGVEYGNSTFLAGLRKTF